MQHAAAYIVFQLIGANLCWLPPDGPLPEGHGNCGQLGAPGLGPQTSVAQGILFEAVLTFILVFAVFGTAVDSRAPKIGGFGVGLAIAIDIMAGGLYTGAAMNPARAIGPMVASLNFTNWYIY